MSERGAVPDDVEAAWSRALGYFLWSMGQIEWETYDWALRLGGHSLKDRLMEQPGFGGRLRLLSAALSVSDVSVPRKKRAQVLWQRAKGFSRFRNRIAHNPIVMNKNYPGLFGIVDARDLKGVHGRYHRMYLAPSVYAVALKLRSLSLELGAFWNDVDRA